MAAEAQDKKVSLEELTVSTLAMTDALAELLIAKGVITDAEFKAPIKARSGQLSRGKADELKVLPCAVDFQQHLVFARSIFG